MNFYLKTYPDALCQLFIQANAEETNAAFDKALMILQKSFSMSGYRKGKVPIELIMKSNPPQLMNMISDIFIEEGMKYLHSKEIVLYGEPRFNPMSSLVQNKAFIFSLVYEIYPKLISAPNVYEEKIAYRSCEIDLPFVEKTLCKQIKLFETHTGKIESSDIVKVEILNPEYSSNHSDISFDTEKLKSLVGQKTGDELSMTFDELTGYLPEFLGVVEDPLKIKIVEILRPKKWSKITDDEIAEKTPYKTKAEYLEKSQLQFDSIVEKYNESQKVEALTSFLNSKIKAEIPKSLWLNNLRDLTVKTAEEEIVRKDIALENIGNDKEITSKFSKIANNALDGLKFIIWLDDIIKKENISLNQEELEYYYYRYAQNHKFPMKDYIKYINQEQKESIKAEGIREKTIAYLIKKITFTSTSKILLSEVLKNY